MSMDKYNDFKNFIDTFIEKVQSHLNCSEENISKNVLKKIDKEKKDLLRQIQSFTIVFYELNALVTISVGSVLLSLESPFKNGNCQFYKRSSAPYRYII